MRSQAFDFGGVQFIPNYLLLGLMSAGVGVCGSLRLFRNPVSHRSVSTLALILHPQQCRVTGIDEIDDAYISLGGVLAVKSARVLLQGAFPRSRHCQHQSVERRMVESFTNQLSGRQQNAWGIGR
jgi:hypothetical protein